jgi:cysteine desulfurase
MVPQALETYVKVAGELFGNPSSAHQPGAAAAAGLRREKRQLCNACSFSDGSLLQVSGGTEANNVVIQGHLLQRPDARLLIAVDTHPSIWFAGERYPGQWDLLPLGRGGVISAETVAAALKSETTLVCMSHVCNETGTVHQVQAIADLCARRQVRLLCDGAQALGHIPVDLDQIRCDFYTFSAHKLGGPRGVGGVFLRHDRLTPLLGGGGQEQGLRPGTENVAGLAATTAALQLSLATMAEEGERLRRLARFLVQYLSSKIPDLLLNSDLDTGLPGLVSISVPGLTAQAAVTELSLLGFALSAGSACHANQTVPSRAILARGRSQAEALGTLRISMGSETTSEEVFELAEAICGVAARQRRSKEQ